MKEEILVYNHFHNGDIFYSRVLINVLSKKFKVNFHHRLPTPLLCDLPDVNEISGIPEQCNLQENNLHNKTVNSWIGQSNGKYVGKITQGCCTFENYFELCKDIANFYEIDISESDEFLPKINFEKVPKIDLVKEKIQKLLLKFKKIILFCNGPVHSGQSENFDFDNIIKNLSSNFTDVIFLTTKKIEYECDNILFCGDITQTIPDLLLVSYISTKSDVVIGRASGPYCFTHVKENLLDQNKTFISFTNVEEEAKWYGKLKSKFIWSNNFEENEVLLTIKKNII